MAYEFTRKTDAVDDVMAVDVNELQAALEAHEFLTLKAATEKTIASDAITATQAVHKLQPESGTADDLATINGMDAGDILILYVSDKGTDTITIKHGTGNISCSGAADIAFTEGAVICYFDGTTVYVSGGGGGAAGIANVVDDTTPQLGGNLDLNTKSILDMSKFVCNGRLTLESGVAVSSTDQANKVTLYFTPYNGNEISLFDGTNWIRYSFAELSLAVGAYTASKPYDIWAYDNAGSVALASTVWTNGTTRATALALQDGIYVKTGATGYRYLGTIYIDAGQKCQDTIIKRFVWNYNNQSPRLLSCSQSVGHNYNGADRKWNNSDTDNLLLFITGLSTVIAPIWGAASKASTAGKAATVKLYIDGALATYHEIGVYTADFVFGAASGWAAIAQGYHNIQCYEFGDNATSYFQWMRLHLGLQA